MNLINGIRIAVAGLAAVSFGAFASGPSGNLSGEYTATYEVARATSRPIRDILAERRAEDPANPADYVVPNIFLDLDDLVPNKPATAPLDPAQRAPSGDPMPSTILEFNGMRVGLGGSGTPPDTTGDAGPDHYFQWVNTSWALFDKTTGALIEGPNPGNTFFAGLGGLCETTDRGDPLVLWDDQAERWIVSQFGFTSTAAPPWLQCVAVSVTDDPLGSYHQYAFDYSPWGFNDYGKMGVWTTVDKQQNAYLFSQHEFNGGFQGASFAVVEREAMLNGDPAQFIRVGDLNAFGAIPFHVEGEFPLESGSCPSFVHFSSTQPGYNVWEMCVDWDAGTVDFDATPAFIPSDPFTIGLNGIPQMDIGAPALDDFGGNTMYLAALRSFGPTGPSEAYGVINHAVDVGDDQAGARWIHFGVPMGTPGLDFGSGFEDFVPSAAASEPQVRIIDQGTYAPDSHGRWMGGINMDKSGNIAFGYNVSSLTLNPELRIAGRLRNDAAGTLRDETQCSPTDTGAQLGLFGGRPRWGDYATMGVDPDDQCTFWFTGEYYPVSSTASAWDTRVCSLKFDSCGEPDYVLETIPSARIAVCGFDAAAEIRVAEFAVLGESAALSQGSVPGGTSLDFGSNSVAAGDSTTVTVTGSAALADGDYTATVNGMAATINRSTDILFGVSAASPATATPSMPGDTQTGIVTRPTYEWLAGSGANEYLIEIASDMAFTQIIDSAVVEGVEYTSGVLLDEDTTYYWRVTSMNYCGSGTTSAAFSFTTGMAGECPAGTTPNSVFSDDVQDDSVAWVLDNAQGGGDTMWNKETPPAGTGLATRAWWADNSAIDSDQRLVSPTISLPSGGVNPLTIAWDAYHQYEVNGDADCWDGGNVEISVNGGPWEALGNSRNLADPYPGQLSGNGPAGIAEAWCRQPAGGSSVRTVFLLDEFEGEDVRIRFRSSSDSNTVGPAPAGWGVDNVEVQSCEE